MDSCSNQSIQYMFGVVILAGGGYVIYRHMRRRFRRGGRGDASNGSSSRYGALDTYCHGDLEDASTNTSPQSSQLSVATQHTEAEDPFDCIVTSPVSTQVNSAADTDSMSSASLVSGGTASTESNGSTSHNSRGWRSWLW